MAAERAAWKASQPEIDIHRLVFIDETGASTKMARLYGRSPCGQRCVAALPHGHWKTTTFVGALRATGMTAPMVLDGPMDGLAFEAYVTKVLAPTLKPRLTQGAIRCGRQRAPQDSCLVLPAFPPSCSIQVSRADAQATSDPRRRQSRAAARPQILPASPPPC